MLNTTSWDPLHIANYVGEYLDLIESLPFDLQRNVSLMREIDSKYQVNVTCGLRDDWSAVLSSGLVFEKCILELLKELDEAYEKHSHEEDPIQQRRLLHCIQRALIRSQELGDEKIQLASQMVEMVENRSRQVDRLAELLEPQESMTAIIISSVIPSKRREEEKRKEESLGSIERISGAIKRSKRQKNSNIDTQDNISTVHHDEGTVSIVREKRNKTSKKKKRSKAKADREPSPTDLPIDPNEPTYCLCVQVSFGEMIGCDNNECPIEWFHFSCVGLNHKPKGKWYCPKCRGDTEKTMDKALEKAKKERAYW